ncbi:MULTISPECIES: class II fructose-bisphosphate aldolase [Halobacteriovorax]|uniref:Fructose-bisphosphate aldolase n=1 Tax=Halobacteriovorax vibrionivorans TaxID=2152716 RepID=A0ABY0IE46_9BACT|nr:MULTISPECIES: class II fructose-bisphosphate aldolase [Halobacteriovorax]AYF44249.1 fructose-bisphosphate aldolase, class II [Halobacteriovorax sp. BALOs_7]RZF21223.1 class II fructose-bisphosphate aldolase [Halobacteriovorax vibrionivorans]TGD48019.1 class II fructose-bisphosphate aldolase [Halobacteriovorax sp. Y22]
MPIATYEQYCDMLDSAKKGGYAYPAINVTSTSTANAAIKAFADMKSDGIIQVSTGGGKFASGQGLNDEVLGAISLAQHVHLVAAKYDVLIALHTDHCHPEKVDSFLIPLIEETEKRRAQGQPNLFHSHMFDGSVLPTNENIEMSKKLLERCAKSEIILEIETGVVGGEEDGVNNEDAPADKLYTTPEEMVEVTKALRPLGKFMYAATFGNVHGVYKPGNVKLRPEVLKEGQAAVAKELGADAENWLVFHGGSGSELSEIHETLGYGVIKMNIDTDTQYAYSRPVVDHMFKNYDEMLKIEGEVGNKKKYDPRAWMKKAENAMTERISQACRDLKSDGKSIIL